MNRLPCRFILPLLAASVVLPCAAAQPEPDPVLVRLGTIELRLADVRRAIDTLPPEARRQVLVSREQLDRFVRTEIFRQTLLGEAKAKSWDRRPEVVALMERAREQALVTAYADSIARPPAAYPAADEVERFYQANEAALMQPKRRRLAQIFVAAGTEAEASRRRAEDAARKARQKNADFAALARTASVHPSAASGGDLGWLAEAETMPELRTAIWTAGRGEVVGPLRTADGWHIVRIDDERPAQTRPLAEVRDSLVALMRQRRAQENERRYLDDMVARTPIAIDEAALARLQDKRDEAKKTP